LTLTFFDAASGDTRKLTASAPPDAASVLFPGGLVLDGGLTVAEWMAAHPGFRLLSYGPVVPRVRWGTRGEFLPPPVPEGGPRYRRPRRARRRSR
jgi:hypothetical protein